MLLHKSIVLYCFLENAFNDYLFPCCNILWLHKPFLHSDPLLLCLFFCLDAKAAKDQVQMNGAAHLFAWCISEFSCAMFFASFIFCWHVVQLIITCAAIPLCFYYKLFFIDGGKGIVNLPMVQAIKINSV